MTAKKIVFPQKKVRCMQKKEITDKEYSKLVDFLVERLHNMAYMKTREKVKEALNISGYIEQHQTLDITWTISFLWNDVIEIIGGLRRKNAKPRTADNRTVKTAV
jgi:hypothetical protein